MDRARALVRRVPVLWSGVYLGFSLVEAARDRTVPADRESIQQYEGTDDLWHYASDWGRAHLAAAERLMAAAAAGGPVVRAIELGCGEGWGTERLARHAQEVVAIDISPAAIERARQRVPGARFICGDLFELRPGRVDLVVAMGLVEVFRRPDRARRVRRRLLEAVVPGGHLLVASCRQHPVVEAARWGPWLPRGAAGIESFLAARGRLTPVVQEDTATHRLTLFRS